MFRFNIQSVTTLLAFLYPTAHGAITIDQTGPFYYADLKRSELSNVSFSQRLYMEVNIPKEEYIGKKVNELNKT